MILEWNGSRRSKAATVFGARSVSSFALEGEGAGGDAQHGARSSQSDGVSSRGAACGSGQASAPRSRVLRDAGAQPAADPGGDLVAVLEVLGGEHVLVRQVDSARSASAPTSSRPLDGEAEAPGGAGRGQPGGGLQRQVALAQQQRQRRLAARDPAPGVGEAAGLEVGRGGGVVGREHVHRAVSDQLPQPLALGVGAHRRRALGDGAERLHVVLAQPQVVRAGLAGHVDAAGAGLGDELDAARGWRRGRCAARSRCPRRRRSRGRSPRPRPRSAARP